MEQLLVAVAAIQLCFLPWALGARAPWAQLVSLGLGVLAIAISVWPRRYSGELAPDGDFILHTWPRLFRFPLFWLGLLFLSYILVGALNPGWERISTPKVWYIQAKEHIKWLPSSIEAPFFRMNAWRMLTIYGAPWLLGCALWAGLTRRVAVHSILITLAINGLLLSLLAITHKMSDTEKMLWLLKVPGGYFHSTFVYKNHAGAYFNIIFVTTLSLTIWHHLRALRRLERNSPAPAFAFITIAVGTCVFMSASRTAMLLLAGYCVMALVTYLVWRNRNRHSAGNPALSGFFTAGTIALVAAAAYFLNLDKSIDEIKKLTSARDQKSSIQARVQARQATWDLFLDKPLTGWGAGSFRHAFPIHQQNYPDIFRLNNKRVFCWDHAHNDYVQALAELGVIGVLFPILALIWMAVKLCRLGTLSNPAFLLLTLGLGLTLAHAWVDFPLYNPAILTTFCAVWVLVVRWAELERSR